MKRSRWQVVLAALIFVAGLNGMVRAQAAPAQSKPQQDEFLKGVYQEGAPGLIEPHVITRVNAKYTPEAMKAKIQGVVKLQAVVEPDGTVKRVRVLESLDKATGLDDSAIAAMKKWKFEPATIAGKPVPVSVELTMEFKLH